MKTERTKYLTYIEETSKHHNLLDRVAKDSSKKAISKNKCNSISIIFLEGEEIVKMDPKGNKKVIGKVENNRLKVKVDETAKFKKK